MDLIKLFMWQTRRKKEIRMEDQVASWSIWGIKEARELSYLGGLKAEVVGEAGRWMLQVGWEESEETNERKERQGWPKERVEKRWKKEWKKGEQKLKFYVRILGFVKPTFGEDLEL